MGGHESKQQDNVVIAGAIHQKNVEEKINTFTYLYITVTIMCAIMAALLITHFCRSRCKNWLRKEVRNVSRKVDSHPQPVMHTGVQQAQANYP